MKRPVRIIMKEVINIDHATFTDVNGAADDAWSDQIWEAMLVENGVTKEMKTVTIDKANSDWIQTFPSNEEEIAIHKDLARKHDSQSNL